MGSGCNSGCSNYFGKKTLDSTVEYTGPPILSLGICTHDMLNEVDAVILQKIINYSTGVGISIPDIDLSACAAFASCVSCCGTCTDLPCLLECYRSTICSIFDDVEELKDEIDTLLNGPYDIGCLTNLSANPTLNQIIQALITQYCTLLSSYNTLQTTVDGITANLSTNIGNFLLNAVTTCTGTGNVIKSGSGATASIAFKGFTPIGGLMPFGGTTAGKFDGTGLGLAGTDMCGWALCVTGDTEVTLSDGNKLPISMIVDNKLDIDVLSFDEITGKMISSKVVNWFKTEVTDKAVWYKIHINHGFSDRKVLTLTHNHPVWVDNKGWVNAENLLPGDKLFYNAKQLTDIGKQALIGLFLSDGTFYKNRFTVVQSSKNRPFMEYLSDKYNVDYSTSTQTTGFGKGLQADRLRFSLKKLFPEFTLNVDKKEKINNYILDNISPVSLAFMYMGDGSLNYDSRTSTRSERMLIHTQGFKKSYLDLLHSHLNALGYECSLYKRGAKVGTEDGYESQRPSSNIGYFLYFTEQGTDKLATDISPYIHPHYRYKLPNKFREQEFILLDEMFVQEGFTSYEVECKNFYDYSPYMVKQQSRLLRYKYRYDIEVENTHSFIANGYIVHNCNGNNGTINMTGQVPMGLTNMGGLPVNATGLSVTTSGTQLGTMSTTLTSAQVPATGVSVSGSHTHDITAVSDAKSTSNVSNNIWVIDCTTTVPGTVGPDASAPPYNIPHTFTGKISTYSGTFTGAVAGGGGSHSNMQPTTGLLYIQRVS